MEFHLYDCMAHLGLTHNFMWSRWNSQLNCRSMALLVREIIEKRKTVIQFDLIFLLNPEKILRCLLCLNLANIFNIIRNTIESIFSRIN